MDRPLTHDLIVALVKGLDAVVRRVAEAGAQQDAGALAEVLDNEERRRALGAAGRQRFLQRFTTDHMPRQGGTPMRTETGFGQGTPPHANEMLDCRQHSTLHRQNHRRRWRRPSR